VIKLFAIYDFQNGFEVSGGPVWQESFYLNIDNTIKLPSALIWNFNLSYKTESWEFRASIDNAFEEEYFLGADPIFGANTLVSKAEPTTYSFSVKYKF